MSISDLHITAATADLPEGDGPCTSLHALCRVCLYVRWFLTFTAIFSAPLQSHQNSTSIGFCLASKLNAICGLLARPCSASSLRLWLPGRLSRPEMKTRVQPGPTRLLISVTTSPVMRPLPSPTSPRPALLSPVLTPSLFSLLPSCSPTLLETSRHFQQCFFISLSLVSLSLSLFYL